MSDKTKIVLRFRGRGLAQMAVECIENEKEPETIRAFWYSVIQVMPKEFSSEYVFRAMSHEEARKFDEKTIDYGKYAGTKIKDLPVRYIEMLADGALEIQAYARSTRFLERQDTEQ